MFGWEPLAADDFLLRALLHVAFKPIVLLALLGFGLWTQRLYARHRSPSSPALLADWKVPGGRALVAALFLCAIALMAWLLTRDPLVRP